MTLEGHTSAQLPQPVQSRTLTWILNWISFIGVGSPRYTLSAEVDPQKEELAKLLINTTSRAAA